MKRSQIIPLPEYFDRYINKCDDVDIITAIQTSIDELEAAPIETWHMLANKTYAPGKWTIKDILQHLIDTERIFSYRAVAFARGEQQAVPSFAEDDYAIAANASHRSIEELLTELKLSRQSVKALFQSFTPAMLNKTGMGFRGPYSVASIGFILPGHQRWHFDIIKSKYYPLLEVYLANS